MSKLHLRKMLSVVLLLSSTACTPRLTQVESSAIANETRTVAPQVCEAWEKHDADPEDTIGTARFLAGNNAARADYCGAK